MRLLVIGPFEASHAGWPIDVGRRQERLLLALLALDPGRTVPTERLVDLIWDSLPPRSARGVVHTYVARLRASLRELDVSIVGRASGYRLIGSDLEVDAGDFVTIGQDAAMLPPQPAAEAYARALSLWRGPILADIASDYLRQRIGGRLEGLRVEYLTRRAEALLAAGDAHRAAVELPAAIAEYPANEELAGHLMTALYRTGRPADALAAFERLRTRLSSDLGLDPSPEITRLQVSILRGDTAASSIPRRATEAGHRRPSQLPPASTGFAGRAADVTRLDEAVRSTGSSSTAVTAVGGVAGVGKTALVLHWAHRAAPKFPDGQLYADLHGWGGSGPVQPAAVLARFLRALGTDSDALPADLDESSALFRSLMADRRMLVVLDNARSADQVRPLFPGGRSVVVVTSRSRLTGLAVRDGARLLTLDVLDPAEALDVLALMTGPDRVAAEAGAAAHLVALCGNLPLAIRIAAAQLALDPNRSIAGYTRALAADRLDALATEDDSASTIRTVFLHSYRAVAPESRELFRAVGCVPLPEFTPASVAALLQIPEREAAARLDLLYEAYLIQRDGERYRLHDLIRLHANELALATDSDEVRAGRLSALMRMYLWHADAGARLLAPARLRLPDAASHSSPGQPVFDNADAAIGWLDAEQANLAALARIAVAHEPAIAWRLADALRGYFAMRNDQVGALAVARAADQAASLAGEPLGSCVAASIFAECASRSGDVAVVLDHLNVAIRHARRAGWLEAEAAMRTNAGGVLIDQQRPTDAEVHFAAALAIHHRLGIAKPGVLVNRSLALAATGRMAEAIEHGLAADRLYRTGEPNAGHVQLMLNLATDYRDTGEIALSFQYLDEADAMARQIGDEAGLASVIQHRGWTQLELGNPQEARRLAMEALAAIPSDDRGRRYVNGASLLAKVLLADGDFAGALAVLDGVSGVTVETEPALILADAYTGLGQPDRALSIALAAADRFRERGAAVFEAQSSLSAAAAALALGDTGQARRLAERALSIFEPAGMVTAARRARQLLERSGTGAG